MAGLEALLVSTGVVALAEIGDKTQLLAFLLAARFRRPLPIVLGILAATLLNHGLAGAVGTWVTTVVSPDVLRWVLGVGFIAMAVWVLIPDRIDADDTRIAQRFGVFGATLITFFLAEMGDKTQIATVAMAAHYAMPVLVVIGTTLGMLIADVPAVFVGDKLANRIPMRLVHGIAAALFALLGIAALAGMGPGFADDAAHTTPSLRSSSSVSALVAEPTATPDAGTKDSSTQDPLANTSWVRVDFDRDAVTRTLTHGFADRATGRPLTADDPARVASISKLVVAIAVMRLVESGDLALDQDVSSHLGWTLRHPGFPTLPITLELLLSHRAGLSDAGGYVGHTRTVLREQLSRPEAWLPEHAPGTWFEYANLGFPVIAAVIERVTGERFDRAMAHLVLAPLGLGGCFNWASCPDSAIDRAAVLYDSTGAVTLDQLTGQRPNCPVLAAPDGSCALADWQPGVNGALFSPQGGLRASANDLARIGRMLLNDGKLEGARLLRAQSVQTMLQPRWTFNGSNGRTAESGMVHGNLFCRYGLATQTLATATGTCGDDLFADGRARVGHAGDAYGLVSGLWLDRDAGNGTAFFVIGGDTGLPGAHSAFYRVEESVVRQ